MIAVAMADGSGGGGGGDCDPNMPDLSHLSAEERLIIEQVLQRQRAEEQKEEEISQRADKELEEIERQINERKEIAHRLVGTQDDAICQICQKTKFADGIGHKCFYCQLRSCARCGGRTTSKNKNIWACSMCQKRQQILARTGKWFQNSSGGSGQDPALPNAQNDSPTLSNSDQNFTAAENQNTNDIINMKIERHQNIETKHSLDHRGSIKRQSSMHQQNEVDTNHSFGLNENQQNNKALINYSHNNQNGSIPASASNQQIKLLQTNNLKQINNNKINETNSTNLKLHTHSSSNLKEKRQQLTEEHKDCTPTINGAENIDIKNESKRLSKRCVEDTQLSHQEYNRRRDDCVERQYHTKNERIQKNLPDSKDIKQQITCLDKNQENLKRSQNEQNMLKRMQRGDSNNGQRPNNSKRQPNHSVPLNRMPLTVPLPENKIGISNTTQRFSPNIARSQRRSKLSRQLYSLSSSDDENADYHLTNYPSTSLLSASGNKRTDKKFYLQPLEQQQYLPSSTSLQNTTSAIKDSDFSEKELLRYIYGSHKFSKENKSASLLHFNSGVNLNQQQQFSGAKSSIDSEIKLSPRVSAGKILATQVRNYLSHPVSWQPSADQRRLIGHLILNKSPNLKYDDFGIKVVGGRPSINGTLSTFIVQVKPDSVADTVGQLRPVDPLQQSTSTTHICGKIEISLLYITQKRELIVTLHRAYDLVPRQDGNLRNPYVKLFLLPDRSEKSRRQSLPIAETLTPIWNETFYYYELPEPILVSRVLEVTVWDYDKYEANAFLGETLIDLSQTLLNNHPFSYILLDMDDENPIRLRLRQRRYSSQTPPYRSRSQTSYYSTTGRILQKGTNYEDYSSSLQNLPYYRGSGGVDRSTTFRHNQKHFDDRFNHNGEFDDAIADFEVADNLRFNDANLSGGLDWNQNSTSNILNNNKMLTANGYLSDYGGSEFVATQTRRNNNHRHIHKRPRSATAFRNLAELDDLAAVNNQYSNYEDVAVPNEPNQMYYNNLTYNSPNNTNYNSDKLYNQQQQQQQHQQQQQQQQQARKQQQTRQQEILQQENITGYGSDGSEGTLSVNSAQSMQNRVKIQQQQQMISSTEDNDFNNSGGNLTTISKNLSQHQLHRNTNNLMIDNFSNAGMSEENVENSTENLNENELTNDIPIMASSKGATVLLSKRKKSLMTRFIPGRNGPSDSNKRMGFARSEEVGVSEALCVPDQNISTTFTKQISKESDSSDNWLPVTTDKPLGNFLENLGPGQVVGRQCLGSAVLGEIQLGLSYNANHGIILDVHRAKNLVVKHGSKSNPAPYIKAYLMDGKNCVAKAKTQPARKTTAPLFQQQLAFAVNARGKMLQISVLGDYGRMERKSFMGIAQINLDELDLTHQIAGWYKLFHSNSLAGGATPTGALSISNTSTNPALQSTLIRKDSELSLN